MKKCIFLVLLCIFTLNLSAFDLSLAHGISAGNFGYLFTEDKKVLSGDLITYKVVEKETRLGLSVNLFSLGYGGYKENLFTKFRDPLSLEVSWDPLYEMGGWLRFNVFQKFADYITGNYPIEYRTGLRVGFNVIPATDEYTGYPFMYLESGLINFEEVYISINMDILLYIGIEYGILDVLTYAF